MTRYAMILNLHDCVGCGTCDIVCKIENQVPHGVFLSHHVTETTGEFPKLRYSYRPIMCNHCEKPACVEVCPSGALHKDEWGLTVVDSDKCVSCGSCAKACPYGAITPAPDKTAADNLADVPTLIAECTANGKEVQEAVESDYPMHDPALDEFELPLLKKGSALKCQMCKHLVYHGDVPRCVEACPMHLEPSLLDHVVRRRDYAEFEARGGMNCIECGCCAYSCPASRHLTQSYRDGKASVTAERRKAAAAAQAKSEPKPDQKSNPKGDGKK